MSYFYAILERYYFRYGTSGDFVLTIVYFEPFNTLFAGIEKYAIFLLPSFL